MSNRLIVLLVFSIQLGTAAAQEAAAPSRAQRDADNPLRLIIEASKIKPRRATEPEKPARAPERIQMRARVAAPADAASAPAAEAPVAAVPVVAPAPVVATPKAEPAPVRAAPESVVREVVVNAPERELAAIASTPAVKVAPPVAPLQVTTMVEPVVPRRLLDRVRGEIEVVVAFTVNTDGSVANPSVQSSSNRLINPTVLEAVAQWRYAPVAVPREHAVQLVMRAGD
jgi:TonB family protein